MGGRCRDQRGSGGGSGSGDGGGSQGGGGGGRQKDIADDSFRFFAAAEDSKPASVPRRTVASLNWKRESDAGHLKVLAVFLSNLGTLTVIPHCYFRIF